MATLTKRKYKSGNWTWEIRYVDPKTKKPATKTIDKNFPKKTVNLIKKKIETELAQKKMSKSFLFLQENKTIMTSEWFKTFLKNIPADKALTTVNRYERVFKQFKLAIDDLPIELLNKQTVRNWRDIRISNGCSQTTVNLEHRHLKACFNQAIKEDGIPLEINPFCEIDMFKISKKLPKIFPDGDIDKFFTYMKKLSDTPYKPEQKKLGTKIELAKMDYAYFLQLYYTGMRPEEPIKFRWENITGNIATIPITKEKQERQKYLHPKVLELLEPKESGKVFYNVVGVDSMGKRFKKYIIASELDTKYTAYWFRHTFITKSLRQGLNTKMISNAVGHTTTKVTEQHYSHLNFQDTISVIQTMPNPKLVKSDKE